MKRRTTSRVALCSVAVATAAVVPSTLASAGAGDYDPLYFPTPITLLGAKPTVNTVGVQSDGKAIVGGRLDAVAGTARPLIARFRTDGIFDSTFAPPLQMITPATGDGEVSDIAVLPNNKVLVAGRFLVNGQRKAVVLLNSNGSLDSSFNANTGTGSVSRVVPQPDGKILIGGSDLATIGGATVNNFARLNANGSLDAALGRLAGNTGAVNAIAVQPDGRIVYGGSTTAGGSIARINANGTPDVTFSPPLLGPTDVVNTIAIRQNGTLLVGGRLTSLFSSATTNLVGLAPSGYIEFAPQIYFGPVSSVAIEPDGGFLVSGDFEYAGPPFQVRHGLAKFGADNTLDTFTGPSLYPTRNIRDFARQPDGQIVIAGDFELMIQQAEWGYVDRVVSGLARLQISNSPPRFEQIDPIPDIVEWRHGFLVTGTLLDLNFGDSLSTTIDWGDGSPPETVPVHFRYGFSSPFAFSHLYRDDPAGPTDTYTIRMTARDSAGGETTALRTVRVANVAPWVTAAASPRVFTAGPLTTVSGFAGDPADPVTIRIDWKDGSPASVLTPDPVSGAFSATHAYTAYGAFPVTVTATDDDGGVTTETVPLYVNRPTTPEAPKNLRVVAVSQSQINVSWRDTSDNEDGFQVERCDERGSCRNFVVVRQTSAGETTITDSGLTPDTQYGYRVRAFNAVAQSSYSDVEKAKTSK